MEPFELFGIQHMSALAMVALFSFFSYLAGRGPYSKQFNIIAFLGLSFYAISFWRTKFSDGAQWDLDLPLALCDITFIFCLLCFINPRPLLVTLVTYWGLGGTLQALITPDVLTAFPSWEFIFFFLGHSAIVFAVFFLLGRAPHDKLGGWAGLRTSFSGLLVYTVTVGMMDAITGWNYGYLRVKPQGASVLDFFGPWPFYVLGGLTVGFVIFAVLALGLNKLPKAGTSDE